MAKISDGFCHQQNPPSPQFVMVDPYKMVSIFFRGETIHVAYYHTLRCFKNGKMVIKYMFMYFQINRYVIFFAEKNMCT